MRNDLRIGLAFPELGEHKLDHFLNVIRRAKSNLDLLVFPEAFEVMQQPAVPPSRLWDHLEFPRVSAKYARAARELSISIIVGVAIEGHRRASASGKESDQHCLFTSPDGQATCYHKHSTSLYNAFFDDDWSVEGKLPVVPVGDVKIGLSICHDSFISLIPRALKRKGAELWVNISHQNVRPHIWQWVLQARAAESNMLAVCTLHRNSRPDRGEGKPQKEPYAFSDAGKVRLRDLTDDRYLEDIPAEGRAGRIYYFDASHYEAEPLAYPSGARCASCPRPLSIGRSKTGRPELEADSGRFVLKELSVESFLHRPETMWRLALDARSSTPVFVVRMADTRQWDEHKRLIDRVIRGRVVEFSTLFLFVDRHAVTPLMAAYRSSNYKDARIVSPKGFPVQIDRRYLKGMRSVHKISLDDPRKGKGDESIYFARVQQLLRFLESAE